MFWEFGLAADSLAGATDDILSESLFKSSFLKAQNEKSKSRHCGRFRLHGH